MWKRRALIPAVALAVALPGALAGAAVAAPADRPPRADAVARNAIPLVNAGFEDGLAGWGVTSPTGDEAAAKTEAGGASSDTRLTHWADHAYSVTTSRRVSGVPAGWWTASATVRSGGGLDATELWLWCGNGRAEADSTVVPVTEQDDEWVRVSVSAYSPGGNCTVSVATNGGAGAWANVDDVTLERGRATRDLRGGDLSGVAKNEDYGAVYRDTDGAVADPFDLLASQGMNLARLKVWVDPADGYNTAARVAVAAARAEAAGMDVMIDFHYSDRWTDPGAQGTPAAWEGESPAAMAGLLADHTRDVLTAVRDAGATVDYVQVGNEINPGMMWPYGQTWDVDPGDGVDQPQWDNLAAFLTAGHDATKEVFPNARTILHLTNINNGIDSLTWWFDEVTARGVPFDLIGLSYYGYWHGSFADLQGAVSELSARYDRDVVVVEVAYPFTLDDDVPAWGNIIDLPSELVAGYPATEAGQASWFRAVQDVVASAPGGRGLGVVYWEPAWTAVEGAGWDPADPASGNAWENQAMFGFDDRLLPLVAAELAPDLTR
ncbi:glycoside hydrolase family 53 protein [Myceligenerans xiligouense]|uniref:Arabinogalactan endo-beta-1,4-galactanase n=1 Tax=Myceligenerans xiligouense TaxID=253184 RepID=A0A3N4YMI7_9MICO|nr:glycosyl hydrolase 53 family protein [Myceligenerans xiligouense]RPF20656.1 arabinogalactan endo-1,4-beta-galactosidase [Myceligenerans xiligouense]